MVDRQGMTAAEEAMAGYVAHAFSHAVVSFGPPTQYGPNTISLARGAIAHLEREGFFVHRVDTEVHDHCDRDPGECSYEALRGEYDELRRRLQAYRRTTLGIAATLMEIADAARLGDEV